MPDNASDDLTPRTEDPPRSGLSRRTLLTSASAASVLLAAGWAGAPKATAAPPAKTVKIAILGTSDLHSNALNWDYYKDAAYADSGKNAIGLARVSTLVNQVRAEVGAQRTLLFDAGDTIQGTPLGFYYATVDPVTTSGAIHPMAAQFNAIGYDAVALGNHEFNYGLDFLDNWISQLEAPALAANAVHEGTVVPRFEPFVIKNMHAGPGLPVIRVGVLGLTNPGVVIWDKANVSGRVDVLDVIESAARWVPVMRRRGVDVIVVSVHAGDSGLSSYGSDLPVENASALLAEQVPGIDVILFGHAHNDVPQRIVANATTGDNVVMSEPGKWGQRVSRFDLDLAFRAGRWSIVSATAKTLNSNTVEDDPALVAVVKAQHDAVVAYVNTAVATSTEVLSAAESCWKDTAILDYVNHVQVETVAKAIAGTPEASLPVISIAAPFNRAATFPAGQVTIKDVAGLYIYDNTLMASVLTGAQIKEYLEYSAKYFMKVAPDAAVTPEAWTNALGTPDYNYDQFSGVTYDVDISQDQGSRIVNLRYDNADVAPDQRFVVAVNNYRQSGGGGFPHIATAPVVYNAQVAIREAIVAFAAAAGSIDPADFHVVNWRLVRAGAPVF
ncbi:bifunctional metallophosphatase/5'-nucleotidase [Microbacterium jejuense]|uniref:bifunctional metallophosphatase/5'-nucleotidase n=1 Tax=Microbacterium jejuense TaxID=1263637 RepID=UPI0031ED14F4